MKKYLRYAPPLFAVATIAFGIIQLITGDFNKGLFPVSGSLPGRTFFAYCSGIILVVLGIAMFTTRWRPGAAFSLGLVYSIYFIFLHVVKLSANIYDGGEWTAAFEVLMLCGGAFLISGKLRLLSCYTLALSLIVFAGLHFKYADYIATLIPAWIPVRLFLAYFIGGAFLLTAFSIILNILTDISAGLIGAMFLLWVIILHSPRAISNSSSEPEWTSLFVALAAGAISLTMSYLSKRKSLNQ